MGATAIRLVVPGPGRTHVLGLPNGLAGWQLPRLPVEWPGALTGDDLELAARLLGTPVAPVRRISVDTWEVESLARIPSLGKQWIPLTQGGRLGADEAIVDRWHGSDSSIPYLRPGHHAELAKWASAVVAVGGPRWLRHWDLGTVVRYADIVVKEHFAELGAEGPVLEPLAGTDPAIPDVLAHDGARLVTPHLEGRVANEADWSDVLSTLGRAQRRAAERFRSPPLPALPLDGIDPSASAALDRLDRLHVPASFVHADVHPGNVVITGSGPVLIDWTDTGWGNPLLALRIGMQHLDTAAIEAWATGFETDPRPLVAAAAAIRVAGSALQERNYRALAGAVPPTLVDDWEEWHAFWRACLDADLAAYSSAPGAT